VDPKFIEEYQENRRNNDRVFWSIEEGYTSNTDNYPYRVFDGKNNALKFYPSMPNEKFADIDRGCIGTPTNFKIVISHLAEVPQVLTDNIMAPFNKSVVVLIKPKIIRTSENLKSVDPNV
jgi:hypothetical protein